MAEHTELDDSVEGARVVDAEGRTVGVVSGVRHGTAYVDPDPGIGDKVKSALGWDHVDEEDYPLQETTVKRVTDDEIRLRSDL